MFYFYKAYTLSRVASDRFSDSHNEEKLRDLMHSSIRYNKPDVPGRRRTFAEQIIRINSGMEGSYINSLSKKFPILFTFARIR